LLDTKLLLSLAYHAQTDRLTERVNQCLESYLRCVVGATPKQWLKWLPLVDLWYNSCYHTSLMFSPFKAIYGTEPSFGSISTLTNSEDTSIRAMLIERQKNLELLKQNLARTQHKMNLPVDSHRSDRSFQMGEMVLLKLHPYAQSTVVNRPCPKLAMKFFGPYKVLEKVHLVFHVSQLKPFNADYSPVF
jgi:hypothetical protein